MDKSKFEKVLALFFWALIIAGIVVRLVNPFIHNPLDYLSGYWLSDCLRHYSNALECFSTKTILAALGILDPVGYQIWLSAVLRITSGARIAVAFYAAGLSIVTPWLWYRWMLLSIGQRTLALGGWAILSILPDWIRLYQFFMQETLLLPLVGLSLWLAWRAKEKLDNGSYLACGLAWGACLATKTTALPLAVIILPWLVLKARLQKKTSAAVLLIAATFCVYAASPVKIFTRIHAFIPFPPGDHHRILFESGKKDLKIKFKFIDAQDSYREYDADINCSSLYHPQLAPLSNWVSSREGLCQFEVDYTKAPNDYLPPSSMTFGDRLKYTFENIIFFFFGLSWPEDWFGDEKRFPLLAHLCPLTRFIWLPMTVVAIFLAFRRRCYDIMTILFAGSLLLFLFQQSFIMEGRYKKPWEGLAVATLIYLIRRNSLRRSNKTDNSPE